MILNQTTQKKRLHDPDRKNHCVWGSSTTIIISQFKRIQSKTFDWVFKPAESSLIYLRHSCTYEMDAESRKILTNIKPVTAAAKRLLQLMKLTKCII